MRAWMVFFAMVPACGFHSSSNPNGNQDANGGDAKIDATPDAPPGPEYGTFIKIGFPSLSAVPTAPLMWMNSMTVNTDGSMCDTLNNQASRYCVIAGSSITLASGKTLNAHGSKPLVLLATSTFDLEGTIDVSSKRGVTPGAGAAASCPNTTAAAGNSGGFGGSFGGKGGDGTTAATPDGTKGTAAPALTTFPADLRGGCPGGNGSSTTAGTTPAGGSGGGAVLIIAVDTIKMNGTINASGAGGRGGPGTAQSGGGGGGSGGMIVLDAPIIVPGGSSTIWLFANGGGGGQGGTSTMAGSGPGDDGLESSAPLTAGAGGNNTGRSGGSGSDGSAAIVKDANDAGAASNSGGGGAGGGGAGFIRTPAIAGLNVLISPAPITP